jgi:SNF2 family DNA or RNA helicase
MSAASPKFRPGDQVRVCSERDRLGVVWQEGRLLGGEFWYSVLFGAERQTLPESNLEPYLAERDPDSLLAEGVFGTRETFAKCVTFRKLQQPLKNALYAFRAARTQFHPHQYKPLLKFLDSPRHRLLIADEVGLGKTIEAGYILQELKARGHGNLRRILIVCPSALCRKWQDELQRRFDEEFAILNAQGFREFLGRVERKGDRAELRAICSTDLLAG